MKYHLAKIGGYNVTKCPKVPTEVQEEMAALITKMTGGKELKRKEQERSRDEIDLDQSDGEGCSGESGNEVIVLKSTRRTSSSTSRGATGDGEVTIDKFYKPESIEEAVQKRQKGI